MSFRIGTVTPSLEPSEQLGYGALEGVQARERLKKERLDGTA